jgi:hypothetical protein
VARAEATLALAFTSLGKDIVAAGRGNNNTERSVRNSVRGGQKKNAATAKYQEERLLKRK